MRDALALEFSAISLFALAAISQPPSAPIEPARLHDRAASKGLITPHLHIDSTLVLIPVIVTDRLNRFVPGLTKNSFRIFEEDEEQKIVSLSSEDSPTSIGIVFDCSGSMVNKLAKSQAAVGEFLRAANPDDEFFLVEFNNQVRLSRPFTWNTQEIQLDVAAAETRGATALLDAIYVAIRQMRNA